MTRPRLIIAGTHSGVGKTTIATGLMRAFRKRGLTVQPFKVGPDFIDPGHHTQAAGRPSRNLDSWMLGENALQELFDRVAHQADLSLIEGVMGLYDGASGQNEVGSTAHVAKLLCSPVVLVIDASAMARSIAAMALGYQQFDNRVKLAGIIANRAGGPAHYQYLKEAIEGTTSLRLLGYLPADPEIVIPERHLGLYTTREGGMSDTLYDRIADHLNKTVSIEQILALASQADPLGAAPQSLFSDNPALSHTDLVVGYARDEAFQFYYPDNLELLEHLGCRLIGFSPLRDPAPPSGADLLYFGGGYPELYAEALTKNQPMRDAVRAFVEGGGAVYAECGGLMYLTEGIRDLQGHFYPMVGVIPAGCSMSSKPTIRYVEVTLTAESFVGPEGTVARGHEFHYSTLADSRELTRVYDLQDAQGCPCGQDGIIQGSVVASYTHLHFGSNPMLARHLLTSLRKRRWG